MMRYRDIKRMSILVAVSLLFFSSHGFAQDLDSIQFVNRGKEVNVAYGKQSVENITSAISYIYSEDIEKASVMTLGGALFGKLAGFHIAQPGGEPGYSSPWYYIRGAGTTTGRHSPLVLVDGIERSLDQIPLEDVESISVLKDAAALSMYGVRGGNGVVLVSTRRGFEGRTKIVVNMEYGFQSPTRLPDFIEAADYARYTNEARINDGLDIRYVDEEISEFRKGTHPLYPNVNWFDELLKSNTPVWKVGTNVSGGDKNVRYFISLSYLKNDGLYKHTNLNDDYKTNATYGKLNFRSNAEININKDFVVALDIAGHLEDRNYPGTGAGEIFGNMYTYQPHLFPMLNPDGSLGGNGVYNRNPYGLISGTGYSEQHDRNLQTLLNLDYKLDRFLAGLSVNTKVSFDNYVRYNDKKSKSFAVFSLSGTEDDLIYTQYGTETSLSYSSPTSQFNRWYTEMSLNYDNSWGTHAVDVSVLYQMGKYKDGTIFPYAHQGVSGRVHYGYANKYLTEFSWSVTGSENAPKNDRFGFFPSLSFGWVISKENFMSSSSWVNMIKLRTSFGLTGYDNSSYGRFLYTSAYESGNGYYFSPSNTWWGGLKEGILANQNITWETNYMFNVGLDAVFFDRLNLTFDFFSNRRRDILTQLAYTIPSLSGLRNGYVNHDEVCNQGFDGTMGWNDKIGKFNYFVSLNGGFARSNIKKIGEPNYADGYRSRKGKSIAQYFGYETIGFFRDQAEIDNSPAQFGPLKPGDVKYKDQNGDGIIDENDEIAIGGTWLPEIIYGAYLGFSIYGFDVSAQFQGAGKRTIFLNSSMIGPVGKINQLPKIMDGRWTPETASTAKYPRLTTQDNDNNYRHNSIWLQPGNFLRLRSLEVGYNVPPRLIQRIGMKSLRVFARGMNMFTWDRVKILDPEVQTGYPMMKSYHYGIRLEF